MSATKRHQLEVGEDPVFQERSWKAQRLGFLGMILFVIAGAFGLFGGGGPLTQATAHAEGVTLDYERFVRFDTVTEIDIVADRTGDGPLAIGIDRRFADAIRIDRIFPPPRSIAANSRTDVYTFDSPAGSPQTVTIAFAPSRIGTLHPVLDVGGQSISFDQFAYP